MAILAAAAAAPAPAPAPAGLGLMMCGFGIGTDGARGDLKSEVTVGGYIAGDAIHADSI